jgi:hypothetical protein
MKWFTRGLGAALVGVGVLGVIGCTEENEAALRSQESKSSEADVKNPTKPSTNQAEFFKDRQDPFTKAGGYPGAKK